MVLGQDGVNAASRRCSCSWARMVDGPAAAAVVSVVTAWRLGGSARPAMPMLQWRPTASGAGRQVLVLMETTPAPAGTAGAKDQAEGEIRGAGEVAGWCGDAARAPMARVRLLIARAGWREVELPDGNGMGDRE